MIDLNDSLLEQFEDRFVPLNLKVVNGKKKPGFKKNWTDIKYTEEELDSANTIAIKTGNGLIVVDVDTKDLELNHPDIRAEIESAVNHGSTFAVETTNGYHLYYSADYASIKNGVRIVDFVDIRGDGGCVFAASEVAGLSYSVLNAAEAAPLPPHIANLFVANKISGEKCFTYMNDKKVTESNRKPNLLIKGAIACGDEHYLARGIGMKMSDFTDGQKTYSFNKACFILAMEASIGEDETMAGVKMLVNMLGFHWDTATTQEMVNASMKSVVWSIPAPAETAEEKNIESALGEYGTFFRSHKMIVKESGIEFVENVYNPELEVNETYFSNTKAKSDEWANRLVPVTDKKGKEIFVNVVDIALKGNGMLPSMHRYKGVSFNPKSSKSDFSYNMFTGFPHAPEANPKFEALYDELLATLSVAYGVDDLKVAMMFMAHIFQFPWIKTKWSIVAKSDQKGTGKNTLAELFGLELLGSTYGFQATVKGQLVGTFNKYALTNLFTIANELTWAGSHEEDSVLKSKISEDTIAVEAKNKDAVNVRNYSRFMITSNAAWTVPADSNDRRYFIIDVSVPLVDLESHQKNLQSLRVRISAEGDAWKRFMMDKVMNMDLSTFTPYALMKTVDSVKMMAEEATYSFTTLDTFLVDAVHTGYFGINGEAAFVNNANMTVSIKDMYEAFTHYHRLHSKAHQGISQIQFGKLLQKKYGLVKKTAKHGIHSVKSILTGTKEQFSEIITAKLKCEFDGDQFFDWENNSVLGEL